MVDEELAKENRSSVVSLGTDAMLELEELAQGLRSDAPALSDFFNILRTPENSPSFAGNEPVSMLADIRVYPVLRDAAKLQTTGDYREFAEALRNYLGEMEDGIQKKNALSITRAKTFCSALIRSLISKDMEEIFSRKEASDSRYMTNALI